MKALTEQTHYEVLEISRQATPAEVERAYRLAKVAYAEGSVAMYSLFDEKELKEQRTQIERAYNVLSDAAVRAEYDQTLPADAELATLPPRTFGLRPSALVSSLSTAEASSQLDELVHFDDAEESVWDGPRLRRNRIGRGIEIEDVAVLTKVSSTMLQFLEADRFDALPATVYLRGFVDAYARCIGLDPKQVVPSYMQRCERARQSAIPRKIG